MLCSHSNQGHVVKCYCVVPPVPLLLWVLCTGLLITAAGYLEWDHTLSFLERTFLIHYNGLNKMHDPLYTIREMHSIDRTEISGLLWRAQAVSDASFRAYVCWCWCEVKSGQCPSNTVTHFLLTSLSFFTVRSNRLFLRDISYILYAIETTCYIVYLSFFYLMSSFPSCEDACL